ncbi:MAG TPA: hypothetical protein VHR97_12690 [Candidatus Baltobacteraceae bacterium]|nr:hypothetical protein [Candidatus Baltobacteraceae bacterium]
MRILLRASRVLVAAASFVIASACNTPSQLAAPGVSGPPSGDARQVPGSSNRPAEIFNEILPYPCASSSQPCPTNFEIIFKGNVTADIPPNIPLSVHENAFCAVSGSGCDPTSVTYNPSSNTTTVEYSGSTLYQNRASGQPGVHFGMMSARNYTTHIKNLAEATEWTYASSPANPVPVVSINNPKLPKISKAWKYAIVFVAGTTSPSGGAEYATWNEVPYIPTPGSGAQPKFSFENYGSQSIYITSSGVVLNQSVPTDPKCLKTPICPENLTLLGNLQEVNYPPPGVSGSPFTKLQYPPKKILKPKK